MLTPTQASILVPHRHIMLAIGGGMMFLALGAAMVVGIARKDPPLEKPLLAPVAVILTLVVMVGVPLVARQLTRQVVRNRLSQDAEWSARFAPQEAERSLLDGLAGAYQSGFVVTTAVFEGLSIFNSLLYLREGQSYSLAAAVLVALAVLPLLPSRPRLEAWVARQWAQADRSS